MAEGVKHLGSVSQPRSPKRKGSHGSANRALVALLLVAFLFSAATMLVASPSVARSIASLDDSMGMAMGGESDANDPGEGASDESDENDRDGNDPPPGAPRSTVGDLVTWILSARDRDAGTQHAALPRLDDSPAAPLRFAPGTLSLTHAETLRHCHAQPEVYAKHFQGGRGDGSSVRVSYSDRHRLAYVMLPKSGSSTARYMLKEKFHARETSKNLQPRSYEEGGEMEGVEVITFVRDPLSRFFSQYDEAYVRTAPWEKTQNAFYIDPETKEQDAPHPFPYLHENIHTYHEYEDVFCPVPSRKNRRECIFRKSQENGTLASRFERFVGEYDGRDPFDIHLTLQVPMLSSTDGRPLHLTQIYNTTDSEGGWNRIAKQFLGEDGLGNGGQKDGGVIAGRSYPRRFNSALVSVETQRRICELTLLDYCCLNLPLPPVCKGRHYFAAGDDDAGRELFCVLDKTPGRVSIQPGVFPEKKKS